MIKCFRISRTDSPVQRVYEFSNKKIRLVAGNQNIKLDAVDEQDALRVIKEHETKTWGKTEAQIEVHPIDLSVGTYHPSISRPKFRVNWATEPTALFNPNDENDIEAAKNTWREIEIITQDLERCFDVNSPFEANFDAFGVSYERLIYFSCIGVESLFRRIAEDNGFTKKQLDMRDFRKLSPALRLPEYTVKLQRYPWLKEIRPFQNWRDESLQLSWFHAYNLLKHEKRKNESVATMHNSIVSAAGYYILAYAVFGGSLFPGFFAEHYFFRFVDVAKWELAEHYFEAADGEWNPRNVELR